MFCELMQVENDAILFHFVICLTANLIWNISVRSGLGTKHCYDAPGDLRVDNGKTQWLTLGEWDFLLNNGSKLAVGKPK